MSGMVPAGGRAITVRTYRAPVCRLDTVDLPDQPRKSDSQRKIGEMGTAGKDRSSITQFIGSNTRVDGTPEPSFLR